MPKNSQLPVMMQLITIKSVTCTFTVLFGRDCHAFGRDCNIHSHINPCTRPMLLYIIFAYNIDQIDDEIFILQRN